MKKTSSEKISARKTKADTGKVGEPSKRTLTGEKGVKRGNAKKKGKRNAGADGKDSAKAGGRKEKKSAKTPVQERAKTPPKKPALQRLEKPGEIKKGILSKGQKKSARGTAKKTTAGEKIAGGAKEKKEEPIKAKENQQIPRETFPSEYGENGVTLMPVDPHKLFAFWEVRKDAIESHEGDLTIRVYEVGGAGINPMDAGSYFDIACDRMGRRYIDVRPGREFIADIGINNEGIFTAIARAPRVSTPRADVSSRDDLPQKVLEDNIRVGY